jgi:hypothetical protein
VTYHRDEAVIDALAWLAIIGIILADVAGC